MMEEHIHALFQLGIHLLLSGPEYPSTPPELESYWCLHGFSSGQVEASGASLLPHLPELVPTPPLLFLNQYLCLSFCLYVSYGCCFSKEP